MGIFLLMLYKGTLYVFTPLSPHLYLLLCFAHTRNFLYFSFNCLLVDDLAVFSGGIQQINDHILAYNSRQMPFYLLFHDPHLDAFPHCWQQKVPYQAFNYTHCILAHFIIKRQRQRQYYRTVASQPIKLPFPFPTFFFPSFLQYQQKSCMKINDSQQSKSHRLFQPSMKFESSQEEGRSEYRLAQQPQKTAIVVSNSTRQIQIILSIIIVVLSTLWVQITMQRNAPFIRTAQCFFNEIILEHYSQDIYEGTDVIYWKTGEYYRYQDILGVFERLNTTIMELDTNSMFNLANSGNQQENAVEILAKYGIPNQKTITQLKPFNSTLSELPLLFQSTVFNRTFYQSLWQLEISISIPIKYRDLDAYLRVQLISEIYSSIMMSFHLNVDILDKDDTLIKGEYDQARLGNRKLHDPFNMGLSIPYLFWIIIGIYVVLFSLQFKELVYRNREVSRLLRERIREERKIEKLLDEINKSQQLLQKLQVNDSSNQSKEEEKIDLNNSHFPIPQKYQYSLIDRVKKIGIYYIAEFLISFISLITCYISHNGIICFFAWLKLVAYLTQTKNKFMVGFLLEETLPIYLKILLNIFLLMTAFVLFNTLVYPQTAKFQTLKLGYFEYIFNYFQYGIYENFILAFGKSGMASQFLYFLQLLYLLYVGNNILQSVLANQVLKNSYVETVKEMIDDLKVDCPACGADPRNQVKSSMDFFSDIPKQKSQFFSKIIKHDKIHNKLQSQYSPQDYHIMVNSPLLSPFFPSKVQRKQSQKFMSPKLKNGNFQKKMKEINKRVQQEQITSESKIKEINKLNYKYDDLKTLKLEISESRIEDKKEDRFRKTIKSKMELLFSKMEEFNTIGQESPKTRQSIDYQRIKETRTQVLKDILQRVNEFKSKVSAEM